MSEENAIVIKPEGEDEIAMYSEGGKPMGMEGYTPTTSFGYLKIDHDTGKIEYTLTGEKKDSWRVVLMTYSFSRIMFEPGMGNPKPLCKTMTRDQNQNNLEGTVYGKCYSCDYGKWHDSQKPACNLNLNLSGMIEGNKVTPVGITMGGSNYKTGINLLNAFFKSNTPMFFKIMKVSTKPNKKGANTYYTFEFEELGSTPADMRAEIAGIYSTYGGMMPGADAADSEPVETSDGVMVVKTPATAEEMEDILLKDVEEKSDTKEEPF